MREKISNNWDPLLKYRISDIDTNGYYGYLDTDGNWCIMKLTATTMRYAKGNSDYATNWSGRLGLTYDHFDEVF
jgi:hypothetical protein